MDASSKTSTVLAKTFLLLFVLIMVAIFLMKPPLTSSTSRVQEERVFEDTIPKDVPIKLKVKKEKERSFKDLRNGNWVREFELELTNTGEKPIYFVFLDLISDVEVGGDPVVFSLVYGRAELGDIISKAQQNDASIKPGETYVFKIHPGQVPAWEKSIREQTHPEATRLRPALQSLSFGDGTGYFGNHPYPPTDKRESALLYRGQIPIQTRPEARTGPKVMSGTSPTRSTSLDLPASFLSADFFVQPSNELTTPERRLTANSCQFKECVGIIPSAAEVVCYNCPPQNRPTTYSAGVCKELRYGKRECFVGGEVSNDRNL